jgi:hypothetical protein
MARSKNTNKLSSGFYRAHDFLRWGNASVDMLTGKKNDWYESFKQMGLLQNIDRLGFPFPNIVGPKGMTVEVATEYFTEELYSSLVGYADMCGREYDAWLDSLKFQFERDMLYKVIPPKAIINEFFSDLEIRMPHEETLLICENITGTTDMVRVEETTIRSWFRKYNDVKSVMESQGFKNESQFFKNMHKTFLQQKGQNTKNQNHPHAQYPWYESLDQEVAAITLTTNCLVNKSDIEMFGKAERFSETHLDTMTRNTSVFFPTTFFIPIGKTVEFYDKNSSLFMHTMFVDDFDSQINNKYHLSCVFDQPFTTPGFRKDGLFTSKVSYPFVEDVNKHKHTNNRHMANKSFDDAIVAHWIRARQVFIHMGIMNHPEFKSLCVEKLKMNGIQPKKAPFNAARPYTKRPGWRPPFEHYVVTINIPDEVSNESNASSHKKRHHLVRGHYMRTATKGFVWRKSHWRGNREMGVVTKDYVMDLEEKLQKKDKKIA